MLCRKRQLDPAGAAANHREAQPRHFGGAGEQRLPARRETGDRLNRDRICRGSSNIVGPRRRANVDRQDVPADRRVSAAQYRMSVAVETDRLVADQARAGKAGKPAEIDVAFLKGVMPGNVTRQHARIGRLDVAGDEGYADAGDWLHAKALQHMDMRMPAADENEVLSDR